MIHERKGDITTATGMIVHQVNCQGVMGSGVALAIRRKWPVVFDQYGRYGVEAETRHSRMGLGPFDASSLLGHVVFVGVDDVVVANCFAQDRYGRDGRKYTNYEALDTCLQKVHEVAVKNPDTPIHFPLLGCGTGGGHWPVVREIIEHRLPDPLIKHLWTL